MLYTIASSEIFVFDVIQCIVLVLSAKKANQHPQDGRVTVKNTTQDWADLI